MFTLLVAAFLAANALSLAFLAMIAVGMVAPLHVRQLAWRRTFIPLLSFLLMLQYTIFVGPPPFLATGWDASNRSFISEWAPSLTSEHNNTNGPGYREPTLQVI